MHLIRGPTSYLHDPDISDFCRNCSTYLPVQVELGWLKHITIILYIYLIISCIIMSYIMYITLHWHATLRWAHYNAEKFSTLYLPVSKLNSVGCSSIYDEARVAFGLLGNSILLWDSPTARFLSEIQIQIHKYHQFSM